MTWITDENNNRASIKRWGSEAAAKRALVSCSRCSRCSRCSDCSRCSEMAPVKRPSASVPVIEKIHSRVLEAASKPGALDMGYWHSECGTTHCRAGWVVTLAGDAGKALEKETSTLFAAMQIYKASDTINRVSPTRFYESDEAAMEDMKRMAAIENAGAEGGCDPLQD